MLSVGNPTPSNVTEYTISSTLSGLIEPHFTTRYPQAYANELEHFLDVLEGMLEYCTSIY